MYIQRVTVIIPPGYTSWEILSYHNFNVKDGGLDLVLCKNTFLSSAEANMKLQQSKTNQVDGISSLCYYPSNAAQPENTVRNHKEGLSILKLTNTQWGRWIESSISFIQSMVLHHMSVYSTIFQHPRFMTVYLNDYFVRKPWMLWKEFVCCI